MRSTEWKRQAACLDHDELFIEQTQHSAAEGIPKDAIRAVGHAKKICIFCPVRDTCLRSAMEDESYLGGRERHGIRGGLTARERILIAAQDPNCARCKSKSVAKWQRICHIKRLCRSCQQDVVNSPESKYFPNLT